MPFFENEDYEGSISRINYVEDFRDDFLARVRAYEGDLSKRHPFGGISFARCAHRKNWLRESGCAEFYTLEGYLTLALREDVCGINDDITDTEFEGATQEA